MTETTFSNVGVFCSQIGEICATPTVNLSSSISVLVDILISRIDHSSSNNHQSKMMVLMNLPIRHAGEKPRR
ncbi:hypothetical protein N8198_06815 [Gammaproteobacteria bacterium]|nr:hypothetical protein [Gammaproteobacteria bacterium]